MEAATSRHCPGRPARFSFASALALALLGGVSVVAVRSADANLPRFGPPPLRFAATPAVPKAFVWPVPLTSGRTSSNHVEAASSLGIDSETNSAPALTNSLPSAPVTDVGSPAPLPGPQLVIPQSNSLSASNLLLLTPQMLADFFKANF